MFTENKNEVTAVIQMCQFAEDLFVSLHYYCHDTDVISFAVFHTTITTLPSDSDGIQLHSPGGGGSELKSTGSPLSTASTRESMCCTEPSHVNQVRLMTPQNRQVSTSGDRNISSLWQ